MSDQIRPLRVDELSKLKVFGEAFFAEKQLPGHFNLEHLVKNWKAWLTNGAIKAVIFGWFKDGELVGVLAGMIFPDLYTGEDVAIEHFWYVLEEHRQGTGGVKLLKTFKNWAHKHGAKRLRMIHLIMPDEDPATVKLAAFYAKLGFRPIEVNYDLSLRG